MKPVNENDARIEQFKSEIEDLISLDTIVNVPAPRWDASFWDSWTPGEAGAEAQLQAFMAGGLHDYAEGRDLPGEQLTSRLSPYLHFGQITPWRVIRALGDGAPAQREAFVRELGWRDFAHHVLHHFPETPEANFSRRFDDFQWREPEQGELEAWQRGRTGVPIVDAGMRELWATGWMHNRVRMIVASYLCKHMRQHWREGARWFWDGLVDADLANNSLGWQWVAGTGADAAPYFRVFNPVTQAAKFDPDGRYVARWLPELAALPLPARHAPWTDPGLARRLAPDYPSRPLVSLEHGRDAALSAWRELRSGAVD